MAVCTYCDGSGATCSVCLENEGCDCDDRAEVACPACHGIGLAEPADDDDDQLACGCGYSFDASLGAYGCPNCLGDNGPAGALEK